MRKLAYVSAACLGAALSTLPPTITVAQVSSFNTRTGAVVSASGDYSITQISGAGTAAQANTGTSGATVPLLNGSNTFDSLQTIEAAAPGNVAIPLVVQNSSNYSSGTGAVIAIAPSTDSTVAAVIEAYSDGGTGAAGMVLGTGSYSTLPSAVNIHNDGGVVVGAPTGGDMGAGTIDAQGLYTSGASTFGSQTNIAVTYDGTTAGPTYIPVFYHTCAWDSGLVSPRSAAILQLIGCPQYAAGSDEEINAINIDGYGGDPGVNIERYDRGTVPTTAATSTSQSVLTFANTPAWVIAGGVVTDNTQGGASVGTVSSATSTTITLTANSLINVASGDVLNIVGVNNGAVQNGEAIGDFGFDPFDGSSDANTAGIGATATETQSNGGGNHGTGVTIAYTPNGDGPYKRFTGITISHSGHGGVTVGDTGYPSSPGSPPTDLGEGTLNVVSDVATGNHYRSLGGTPAVSSCGTSPTIYGTDNAGYVGVGSSVTSCTITFVKAWNGASCIVQNKNNTSPVAYVNNLSNTVLVVEFSAAYTGSFYYICQGWS